MLLHDVTPQAEMAPGSDELVGVSPAVLARVKAEYLEMPGLQLTVEQAARLWALDRQTCGRLLRALEGMRFLVRTRHDAFARP